MTRGWPVGQRVVPDETFLAVAGVGACLDRRGIPWFIGGSVASSWFGNPRSTLDVDLVVALPLAAVDAVAAELDTDYYADAAMMATAVRTGRPCNLIHQDTQIKVDLYPPRSMPMNRTAFDRRRSVEVDGCRLTLASPEDVILSKLLWWRLGGGTSERQLRDVAGVVEIQGEALDMAYIDGWLAELDLRPVWDAALRMIP
jgi:hypothetical protein